MPIKEADKLPAEIHEYKMEPKHLASSLADFAAALPHGKSFWRLYRERSVLERQTGTSDRELLQVCVRKYQSGETLIQPAHRIDGIGVCEILVTNGEKKASVTIDTGFVMNSQIPQLKIHMITDDNLPQLDTTQGWKSQAELTLSLGSGQLTLPLIYGGDDKTLKFSNLLNFSPEQLRILFSDELIPDININKVITYLLSADIQSARSFPTPEFTFDQFTYVPELSHFAFPLSRPSDKKGLIRGCNVSGVVITRKPVFPYTVNVEIKAITQQHPRANRGDRGPILFHTNTTIDNGSGEKTHDLEFHNKESLFWLKDNKEAIISSAFVAAMQQASTNKG